VSEPNAYDPSRLGKKGCLALSLLLLVLFPVVLLNACISSTVVARAVSPDGKVVARLYEINGGATTDFAYTVRVSRKWPRWDHQVADFYAAHRSDCAYGVNLRWPRNDTLVLEYLDAEDASVQPAVEVAGRGIRIVPMPNTGDPKAPCGGMLYNQQGRPYG